MTGNHIRTPARRPVARVIGTFGAALALTWAAAATKRIRLGTTVLVLPLRPPVLLAKMLGTLDLMSGSRLLVGAASGWLKDDFDALGVPFDERGARNPADPEVARERATRVVGVAVLRAVLRDEGLGLVSGL